MSRRSRRQAGANQTGLIRPDTAEYGDHSLYVGGGEDQCCHNVFTIKGLSLAEHYRDGRLEICFPLEVIGTAASCSVRGGDWIFVDQVAVRDEVDAVRFEASLSSGHLRVNPVEIVEGHRGKPPSGDDKLVLVSHIKGMDAAQHLVPTRIRFKQFYETDDLWAGEPYLTVRDGLLKSMLFLGEGELDRLGPLGFVSNKAPHGDVERGPQIVDRIANDERERGRDGFLGFDPQGSLSSLFVLAERHPEGFAADVSVNLPIEVADVMLGPINLKRGRFNQLGIRSYARQP